MTESKELNQGRRSFLSAMGLLGIVSLCPQNTFAAAAPKSTTASAPFQLALSPILKSGPYLQFPTESSMTIRWITHVPCQSWVEYGSSPEQLDKKATTVQFGMVKAGTINAITLKNLQPGKTYYYRIHSQHIVKLLSYKVTFGETYLSEVHSFETFSKAADTASFLVFNDIHDRPESFPLLLHYKGEEPRDFVFLNGDMFNYQDTEDQLVDHLLTPISGLSTTVPFFLSRGNHETRGPFARNLPEYFNGTEPHFYYAFQHGPVYVIVLDSGEDKPDDTPVYANLVDYDNYRLEQAEWLKEEMKKPAYKKAKYKVVFSHIPLYYSGTWHGTMHCREIWGPIFNAGKIDLLLSGHTHRYGIHQPVKGEHNYPIVIGGGPKDTQRTLIKVKADRNALLLHMINDAGKEVGSLTI
jgi:predicted MPP superfamily phosphohydrolase